MDPRPTAKSSVSPAEVAMRLARSSADSSESAHSTCPPAAPALPAPGLPEPGGGAAGEPDAWAAGEPAGPAARVTTTDARTGSGRPSAATIQSYVIRTITTTCPGECHQKRR